MRKKIIAVILIVAMALLSACGTKLYTTGEDSGYTLVDDVNGVSFGIISKVVGSATAVTNISENMVFERNQTYLFKDGDSEYLLFNIGSLVLAAQRGTTFGLSESTDKQDAVLSNNVLGIWFDLPGKSKKLEYTDNTADGVYKFMATVTGEVSVTSELFNDFAGKLVVISDGEEEWSLFVGSAGNNFEELSDDTKDVITYMAASLQKAEKRPEVETAEVAIGGEDSISSEANTDEQEQEVVQESADETTEDVIVVEEVSTEDIADADIIVEESTEDTTVEEIAETESDDSSEEGSTEEATAESSEEEIIIAESSDEASEEASEEKEEVKEAKAEETKEVAETESEEQTNAQAAEESPAEVATRGSNIKLNNQRRVVRDDNTVYKSTIYDMLSVGKWGYAEAYSKAGPKTLEIKVTDLKVGSYAENIIIKACKDGVVPYKYFSAPAGCSWNLVKLTAKEAYTDAYIDVKIVGADGNKLNFRGIKYPERTYNIPISDTEKYVYYAVPNGCQEYVLEVGDGTINNELSSAYYLVR